MVGFNKPIRRARGGASIGGVCSGLAAWFGCDLIVVRVAYILLTVFTGVAPGVLAYLVLWVYLPSEERLPAAS